MTEPQVDESYEMEYLVEGLPKEEAESVIRLAVQEHVQENLQSHIVIKTKTELGPLETAILVAISSKVATDIWDKVVFPWLQKKYRIYQRGRRRAKK